MKRNKSISEKEDVAGDARMRDRYDVHLQDGHAVANFGASFIISGVLAATFKTMTAPLERVKLILQTQASSRQMAKAEKIAYSGLIDAFVRISRDQGFFSLWRGNLTNICRYVPSQAINFSFFDVYYHAFVQVIQPQTIYTRNLICFLAGGAVGISSCVLLFPLTFCTTRITVDIGDSKKIEREFRNLSDCLCKIYRLNGVKGFYQGLLCSAMGMFVYRSTYFGIYTTGKQFYLQDFTSDPMVQAIQTPVPVSLVLAQSASTISTYIAYPLDTISRHKMLWSASLRQVSSKIMESEGAAGFYRGVVPNLLTTVCGTCILVCYDVVKDYYQNSWEKDKT